MQVIEPAEEVVLVELISKFGNVPTVGKPHDTYTSGKILAVGNNVPKEKIGKIAHWRGYKDDARVGDNQCLIEVKDILGYASTDNNN